MKANTPPPTAPKDDEGSAPKAPKKRRRPKWGHIFTGLEAVGEALDLLDWILGKF